MIGLESQNPLKTLMGIPSARSFGGLRPRYLYHTNESQRRADDKEDGYGKDK